MIKSVVLTSSVGASSQVTLRSPRFPRPFSPVSIVLWPSVSETGSWWTVFFTKSPVTVTEPQPGDPPPLLWQAQTTYTNVVVIPLDPSVTYEAELYLTVVFNNASTSSGLVTVWFFYEER